MSGRGRPPNDIPSVVIHVKLTLDPRSDADIIEYLESAPHGQRAAYAVAAMRSGGDLLTQQDTGDPTLTTDQIAAELSSFLC